MLISLLLAWVAALSAAMAALKYIARVSGSRPLNRFFSKCHIPFGLILLITGVLHGVVAGNPSWATLGDFTPAAELFTLNWGTACLVLAALLALTYFLRRRLKKRWMPAHRVLTVLLIACLALHLLDVGIQLPDRLLGGDSVSVSDSGTSGTSDSGTSDSGTSDSGTSDSGTSGTSDSGTSGTSDSGASDSGTSGAVTFSGAVLQDGTYEGSAQGYSGTTTVSVTVSGGAVTDITVVSESDSPQYFSRAESLLDEILGQQSLTVDAVTGATFSSAGLLNAVSDALQGAVVSGTLEINSIDVSSISRGHGH